ncbi:regulatory LuxR family protein [Litoreibacter ponti]|uniref:Regulatory LuxR family protein n=1 Tax=Litoreibacter ponti TaxID=1510457 RepID=A0A2T6BF07_9RHOB|nr:helix-turn-helix domain-containing protein [Litoreibacter ponti]PTX54641.1 regulatory LuxR family protein [Litoreibacter ponti]
MEPEQWLALRKRICEMCPGFGSVTTTFDGPRVMGTYSPSGFVTAQAQLHYDALAPDGHIRDDVQSDRHVSSVKHVPVSERLGNIASSREWYGDAEYRETPAYKTFFEPAGFGHWTTLCFAVNGNRTAVLTFSEVDSEDAHPDQLRLKHILELISPHVVRGARIARALYMAKEAAETYKGFLDGIALPLIIVDAEGLLQVANAAGQKLIDRSVLMHHAPSGLISLVDDTDNGLFRRALREAKTESDPRGLVVDYGNHPASICVAPFHPTMMTNLKTEMDVFGQSQLFAVFFGTKGNSPINSDLLQDVFQLTRREADVCSALVAGQSPAQIAETQGRAEKTIRNQIQSVHDKIGVTSTRELAEALSVFRTVGAMFDSNDPHLFGAQKLPSP